MIRGNVWLIAAIIGALPLRGVAQEIFKAEPIEPGVRAQQAEPVLEPFNFDPPQPAATPRPQPTPTPRPKPTEVPVVPAERFVPAEPVVRPSPTSAPAQTLPPARPAMTPFVPEGTPPEPRPQAAPEPPRPAPGTTEPVSDEQRQMDYANGLYARKMHDLAAPEYEKIAASSDKPLVRQMAFFRLGECYRALGRMDLARNAYDNVVSLYVNGEFVGPAAYRLADLYYQEKDYATALPLFRKSSVRNKDPVVVLSSKFYTARCLDSLRLYAEARSVYEDVVGMKGTNPFREASRLSLARLYTDVRRKEDAIRQLDALAKETEKPDLRAEALVKSALLKIETGKAADAAPDLVSALAMPEIGTWRDAAQVGLMHTLFQTGKYEELLQRFEAMGPQISPERRPELLILAANAQRQLGRHDEARAAYEEVVKNFPDSPFASDARFERLVSLYNANDPAVLEAADDFLAKADNEDKRDQATLLKAEALYKRSEFAKAMPVYEQVIDSKLIAPSMRAEALFKLGWCAMQSQNPKKAVEAYTRFITDNRTNRQVPAALVQRALAHQQLKQYSEALMDFQEILSRHPKAKERELALQQKALILGQQQDNKGMASTFRQLLKEFPQTPAAAQANYWIGWSAFEIKDYSAAIEPLETARKLDKKEYLERASLRIILAQYYLERREPLAAEVDFYVEGGGIGKVPAEVLRWLGMSYLGEKQADKAVKYLGMLASRKDEAQRDDLLNYGRALLQNKDFADAEKLATEYLATVTDASPRANGLLLLGRAKLGAGDRAGARKAAQEAAALQPEGRLNAEGRLLLGDVSMAGGEFDDAARTFMGVAVVFDDASITPQALEKAALAYKKAGKSTDAAKAINTLQSRYPEHPITQ